MSGQTPGQGDDGDGSTHPSQQLNTSLHEEIDTQEADGEVPDQETTGTVDKSDDGRSAVHDVGEEAAEEDEQYDDNNNDHDEIPERPSSRLDFAIDEEGNAVMFQSTALSHVSEVSNETTRSMNPPQDTGTQPATDRENSDNSPEDSESDSEPNEESLADVAKARNQLFDRIFARFRDENLYTNPRALVAAEDLGTMPGAYVATWWNTQALRARLSAYVEELNQYNTQPLGDGTVLPIRLQNHIRAQLQGMEFIFQQDAERWFTQGLRSDTDHMLRVMNSIDDLLANRPRAAPTSRALSMVSSTSGPERVGPNLDRARLRRQDPDILISMILEQENERRVAADQFEADIEIATAQADYQRDEAVRQQNKAVADLEKLIDRTQKLREMAYENGLNNRDINGQPLQERQTPTAAMGTRNQSDYTHDIEDKLLECNNKREKDRATIETLRFENADLRESLQAAWEEARQAREEADMARPTGPNAEAQESGDAFSGQEMHTGPSSEVSTSGQEAAPGSTGGESNNRDDADREPTRDADAELEALRIEHRLELAQLRADYTKEIKDLRSEIGDDRRRAQGSHQEDLSFDSELPPSQEVSGGSVRSQGAERRKSSDKPSGTSRAPRLDDVLEALWADDDEAAYFMDVGDSSWQGEKQGQIESDLTSQRPPTPPTQTGSESSSTSRSNSPTTAGRLAEQEKRIQELNRDNTALRRRLNTTEQMREGAAARTRHLEAVRNGLQENFAKAIHREDGLRKQISALKQARNDLQQALEGSEEAQGQLAAELESARNTLQLHLASPQTTRDIDQDHGAEALQQRVGDLEAANKILRDEVVAEQAANSVLQQRFADVDQERANLQTAADDNFVTYQEAQDENNNQKFQNINLDQNIRRTTRERDNAREELDSVRLNLENAENSLQGAEAERDQAILDLQEAETLIEEQAKNLQKAENDAQAASSGEVSSRKMLADVRRQLKECQAHRAAQGSTPAPDHPDVNIVERLLQAMNKIRQFAPHAHEIAQFATVLVQAGRTGPATLEAELRQVTNLAKMVHWPDDDFIITPAQREDPELLDAELTPWLSTIGAAIDDSVRLSAAVGSLRVAVELWNLLNPQEQDGSHGGRSTGSGSERGNSQAGPLSSRHSIASTADSFTTPERGELSKVVTQAVNQFMREHPNSPVDDARRLMITSAAADLFLNKLMGEKASSDNGGEEGETESRVTSSNDVENSSAGSRSGGRPDRMRPNYIDPAWLRAHRSGPCKDCVPVQRFPVALFPGGVDPGPCKCGLADTISIHSAESQFTRSSGLRETGTSSLDTRSSRTRSVAFSDAHGADDQDAPGEGVSNKPPRSILKRFGSLAIDTAKDKARTSRAPLTPYPKRARSLPRWNAAKLPFPRQTQRSKSAWSLPPRQLSHDNAVPIMPVQKNCCAHFDERRRVCECKGECGDHWCCEHWDVTGVCKCNGTCHVPCCKHWKQDRKSCDCKDSCAEHTSKKCCPCGFKPGIVPDACACDNTCRDHAVCEHFRTYKPDELSCMAGCDAFKKDGKCEHGDVCRKIPCDAHPCDAHPCCTHHVSEDSRAYCGCGKTCGLHVCCSHWLPDFKTCECRGTCQDHLPPIPERLHQHFREVAAVAEAQTTPPDLAAKLYHPAGRMFSREDGEPYDWYMVVRANMYWLTVRGLVGSDGDIMAALNARQASRTRTKASQDALAASTTSTAPPAPPGAFEASLRGGSGVPGGSRGMRRRFGLRNNALPDIPQSPAERLFLDDRLFDFPGPLPDFGNDEDRDSTRSTRSSSRRTTGDGAGRGGCGCKCRCQGNEYHELTGPGGRFAFYTCRRMHAGGGDDEDKNDNSISAASSSIRSPATRSEIYTRHSSLQNSADAVSRARSRLSSLLSSQGARSRTGSRQGSQGVGSRGSSPHGSQGIAFQLGSRVGSRHSSLQVSQGAGSQAGSRRTSAKSGTASASDPGAGAGDQNPDIGDLGDQRPEDDVRDNGADGGRGGGEPGGPGGPGGGERPLRPLRPGRRPLPNPWRQIWDFAWLIIRFLTHGQAINLQAILTFAYHFALLNIQQVLHFLHLAQLWQRLPNPRFPRAETISFMLWSLLVWQLTMMIALGEERRLWLAANPRTAAYVRGLQFREPYPRWSLFQVDYALLRPALSGFSVWLHGLYFRPGMFGGLGHACGSLRQVLSYSRVEEAVVHVKDVIFEAGKVMVMLPVVIVTDVWAFIMRMLPSWLGGVSSVHPGSTGGAVNLQTPTIPAQPPSFSDPQMMQGGAAWWEVFWEYFKDLVVRTVTGRRKVSNG